MNPSRVFISETGRQLMTTLLSLSALREIGKWLVKRKIAEKMNSELAQSVVPGMVADEHQMLQNLVNVVDRWLSSGHVRQTTLRRFVRSFSAMAGEGNRQKMEAFEQQYGFSTPRFVTISPTMRCNLKCTGCYAESSSNTNFSLDHATFDRIIREQKELWGSHFTVISGGEPLLWRDSGVDLLDVVEAHPDTFFLMYTNGTHVDRETAERIALLGNLTPCLSVEGFERETDARRGGGVHRKVIQAFENLYDAGVLYGISITVTRANKDAVFNDSFVDYYFRDHGVSYGWIFQYMPVGRGVSFELMPTPRQRVEMLGTMRRWIRDEGLFLADFWNSATLCNGCLSAGRKGGYVYIDWNGNVMPCVFNPYSTHNIHGVFAEGGTICDVVASPYMKRIREWQSEYYDHGSDAGEPGNMLAPCPLRDHHQAICDIVAETGARPTNESALAALGDQEYHQRMIEYGQEIHERTRNIWEEQFLRPSRC